MLMQDAVAALVRDSGQTYGVVRPTDLGNQWDSTVGELVDGEPLWALEDDSLAELVREIRWHKKPAIVLDRYNAPVGIVTMKEAARAAELRRIADRGLSASGASTESQEHGV